MNLLTMEQPSQSHSTVDSALSTPRGPLTTLRSRSGSFLEKRNTLEIPDEFNRRFQHNESENKSGQRIYDDGGRNKTYYDHGEGGRPSYDGRGRGRFARGGRGIGRGLSVDHTRRQTPFNSVLEGQGSRFQNSGREEAQRPGSRLSLERQHPKNERDTSFQTISVGGNDKNPSHHAQRYESNCQKGQMADVLHQELNLLHQQPQSPESYQQNSVASIQLQDRTAHIVRENHDASQGQDPVPDNYRHEALNCHIGQELVPEANRQPLDSSSRQKNVSVASRHEHNISPTQNRLSESNRQTSNVSRDHRLFSQMIDQQDSTASHPQEPFIAKTYRQSSLTENRGHHYHDQTIQRENNQARIGRFNSDNRQSGRGPLDRSNDVNDNNNGLDNYYGRRHPDRLNTVDRFDDDHSTNSGGRGRVYQGRGRGSLGGRFGDDQERRLFQLDDSVERGNQDENGGHFNDAASVSSRESGGRGRFVEKGGRSFRGGPGRNPFEPGRGRLSFRGGRGRGTGDGRGFGDTGRGSAFGGRRSIDRDNILDGNESNSMMVSPRPSKPVYVGRGRGYTDQPSSPRGGRGGGGGGYFSHDDGPHRNGSFDDGGVYRKRSFENNAGDHQNDKRPKEVYKQPKYDGWDHPHQPEGVFHQDQQQPPTKQHQQSEPRQSGYGDPRERQDPRQRSDPRDRLDPRSTIGLPHVPARTTSWSGSIPSQSRHSPISNVHGSGLGQHELESGPLLSLNDDTYEHDSPRQLIQKSPHIDSSVGFGGRFDGRVFGRGRGRFDRDGRVSLHHRQRPPDSGLGSWSNYRIIQNSGDREVRASSYASLAADGPDLFLGNDDPRVQEQSLPEPSAATPEPEITKEADVVPPSPPPDPTEPSAFTVALTRMVELESQLDFVYAKHLYLIRQTELLTAQIDTLRDLPVGREAFQEDLDKLVAAHECAWKEAEERKKQEEENTRREAAEAKKLEEAALRGRVASEDTTDEGLIEE